MKRDRVTRDCQHARVRHEHGTNNAYVNDGCRCDPCREAARLHKAAQRKAYALGRPPATVPTVASRRYVGGLRVAGWPLTVVARELGMTYGSLWETLERDRITRRKADRIRRLHDRLILQEPPESLKAWVTSRARTLGAVPALAWDDIDDPLAEVSDIRPSTERKIRPSVETAEEYEHFRAFGYTDAQIAERLGVELNALQIALKRAAA